MRSPLMFGVCEDCCEAGCTVCLSKDNEGGVDPSVVKVRFTGLDWLKNPVRCREVIYSYTDLCEEFCDPCTDYWKARAPDGIRLTLDGVAAVPDCLCKLDFDDAPPMCSDAEYGGAEPGCIDFNGVYIFEPYEDCDTDELNKDSLKYWAACPSPCWGTSTEFYLTLSRAHDAGTVSITLRVDVYVTEGEPAKFLGFVEWRGSAATCQDIVGATLYVYDSDNLGGCCDFATSTVSITETHRPGDEWTNCTQLNATEGWALGWQDCEKTEEEITSSWLGEFGLGVPIFVGCYDHMTITLTVVRNRDTGEAEMEIAVVLDVIADPTHQATLVFNGTAYEGVGCKDFDDVVFTADDFSENPLADCCDVEDLEAEIASVSW